MRLIFALAIFFAMTACQVSTSQSIGGGVAIRSSVPLGGEQATDHQTTEDQDTEAEEDRMQDLTIGGGFSTRVSN
jgi:hypothetical protein